MKLNLHSYHLVTTSPWPFLGSLSLLTLVLSLVARFHGLAVGLLPILALGLFGTVAVTFLWLRDIVREGTLEGSHTAAAQKNLKLGFLLFIGSEIMFFMAFFWGFFHGSLSPGIEIGGIWPPTGLLTFNPFSVPLLNTCILLLSGASVTYTHYALLITKPAHVVEGFLETIILAIAFTALQILEYKTAAFSISDGIYGSVFFMITGLHGTHVLAGTVFLFVCFLRHLFGHFTKEHHLGFEFASWYWHFVDVVWLYVYSIIYCWGQ